MEVAGYSVATFLWMELNNVIFKVSIVHMFVCRFKVFKIVFRKMCGRIFNLNVFKLITMIDVNSGLVNLTT